MEAMAFEDVRRLSGSIPGGAIRAIFEISLWQGVYEKAFYKSDALAGA